MPIFMQVPNITGDVVDTNYLGWFNVSNMAWEESRPVTGLKSGNAVPGLVTIARNVTKGSVDFFAACGNGQHFATIVIDDIPNSSEKPFVRLTLTACQIVNYQVGFESGVQPTEQVSILFDKMKFENIQAGESAVIDFTVV